MHLDRLGSRLASGALILAGAVWSLQGAGLLGGSPMSGRREWLVIGVAAVALGAALAYRELRRP